jgi:hypothetical protein
VGGGRSAWGRSFSFWIILLGGIAIAIAAMWSMLYRPAMARSVASS